MKQAIFAKASDMVSHNSGSDFERAGSKRAKESLKADLASVSKCLISDPRIASRKVLDAYIDLIADQVTTTNYMTPAPVIDALAFLPENVSAYILENLCMRLEALKARKVVSWKKPIRDVFKREVDERRLKARGQRKILYDLLDLQDPDIVADEEKTKRKEREELRRDRQNFSSTFSKSSARTVVQGGAPGLKR